MATQCPITREQFREHAQPFTLKIGDTDVVYEPWEFSSDSFGWKPNAKPFITIDGQRCKLQLSNIWVIGSKHV